MSRGALGSYEAQEWLQAQGILKPRPDVDLLHYLAGEFQEGAPMRVTTWQPDKTGKTLSDREVSRLEVLNALRYLPYRQRRIIELLYIHNLPQEAVCQKLNISERHMRRERRYALQTLAQHIYEWI